MVDGTVGTGGHAAALLECVGREGFLLGLDRDPTALAVARRRLASYGQRVELRQARFSELASICAELGLTRVDGILLDLGLCSLALDDPARGFAFQIDGPLDMRFDPAAPFTAAELLRQSSAERLAALIRELGEEPRARRVARAIERARNMGQLSTTRELAQVVRKACGPGPTTKSLARVFQALRLAVNDELGELRGVLPQVMDLLAPSGRVAVISYHSLEDRIVKEKMKTWGGACVCPPRTPVCRCSPRRVARLLTPHPVRPSAEEVSRNPRARSARLRVAEKLEGTPLSA